MRRISLIIILTFICAVYVFAGDIYVSPDGDDQNMGTRELPLRTPQQALRMAREWRRLHDARIQNGIHIILRGGEYYMREPLFLRPEDSGTAASPTVIRSEEGERAILHGDTRTRHTPLYPSEGMARLTDFDKEKQEIRVESIKLKNQNGETFNLQRSSFNPLEIVIHQRWAMAILRIKNIREEGNHTVFTVMEPESRREFEHPWPQPVIGGEKGNSSFLIRQTKQREGIERLVFVNGTENEPIRYVTFKNLTFERTCWNRPLREGHVTLQGGFPIIDAYQLSQEGLPWAPHLENQAWIERPVAAASVKNAQFVDVENCRFENLAATALDYETGISDCLIANNTFENIGGTAILAGSFAESPREVHRPYTDLAPLCDRLTIRGNTIHDATNEDWGAVGIGCGYVRNTIIENNEVSHVNNSGICVGWGWTPIYTGMENNIIRDNHISHFALQLYDAGGIYTLSNQPHSRIENNVIEHIGEAPYATNDRGFCIYLDAETNGFTLTGNTFDGKPVKWKQIGTNNPGKEIIIK